MNTRWIAFRGTAGIIALCLAGCSSNEPIDVPPPVVPAPATRPAPLPPRPTAPLPETPIRLEKPRVLGPVTPTLVAVPAQMAEPSIRIKLTDESDTPPVVRKAAYRGRVDIVKVPQVGGGIKYAAVNTVPIEAYLQGVLAKELFGSWQPAAFRAQAVAARTFALYSMKTQAITSPDKLWDVSDDEGSQMYGGIAGETAKARAAVADTRGQVLTYTQNGVHAIFCARFSACSGGASQDPADAWADGTIPPLSARTLGPIDDNCPQFHWPTMSVSKSDITRCIRSWGERNAFSHLLRLGEIRSVTISARNAVTGRPTIFTLTDTAGRTAPIRAEEFRIALLTDPGGAAPKPPSSFFDIHDAGAAIQLINGKGHGHGIGLSQWGAQALALRGEDDPQILSTYYPGAAIRTLW